MTYNPEKSDLTLTKIWQLRLQCKPTPYLISWTLSKIFKSHMWLILRNAIWDWWSLGIGLVYIPCYALHKLNFCLLPICILSLYLALIKLLWWVTNFLLQSVTLRLKKVIISALACQYSKCQGKFRCLRRICTKFQTYTQSHKLKCIYTYILSFISLFKEITYERYAMTVNIWVFPIVASC